MCAVWQVWEQCVKFLEGSTTISLEKVQKKHVPLPHIALCMKQRYRDGVLASMGLPDDFFDNRRRTELELRGAFPDLNATWNNVTWSLEDMNIDWSRYKGMLCNMYIFV